MYCEFCTKLVDEKINKHDPPRGYRLFVRTFGSYRSDMPLVYGIGNLKYVFQFVERNSNRNIDKSYLIA